jgi:CarD family transcriptional regulator
MAARKKVTKKASESPTRSGSNQVKRKAARAQTSKTRPNRPSTAAKTAGKADSAGASSSAAKKRRETAAVVAKRAASSSLELKSTAKVAKTTAARPKAAIAAKSVEPKGGEAKEAKKAVGAGKAADSKKAADAKVVAKVDAKKAGDAKVASGGNAKGAESQPARSGSTAAGVTGATTKASTGSLAKPAPGAVVSSAIPEGAAKAVRVSAATKPDDRDSSGGEQKTMKNSAHKHGFKLNEFVVYPAHGVGQIVAMEEQEVAGFKLELFVINFVKDKMTLRVPTAKVAGVGMRKLSDPEAARRSLEILTGRARIKRTMWSRRAQEYEAKINSGDINAIAEVVRDLYRSEAQPEQSYSERQLYEAALDRMMREIAAVQKLSETEALKVIETQLKKNQRRGAKADAGDGEAEDAGIEEAA